MKIFQGILVWLNVIVLGLLMYHFQNLQFYNSNFAKFTENQAAILKVHLLEEPEEKANSWRSLANVTAICDNKFQCKKSNGKVLIYWSKKDFAKRPDFKYGDDIWMRNHLVLIQAASFPGDFNFRDVMEKRNVKHQIFLRKGEFKKTGNSGSFIFVFANSCREKIINRFHELLPSKTAAMLSSLIIGYREELTREDTDAFSKTGTTHVLAVSGLHVGLIYMILIFLFTGKIKSVRVKKWQGIMILLFLWIFALVTGLSASVVRAAIMFTIVESGRTFFIRKAGLLNLLLASAFIQLCIQPTVLFDVGFQLSYLAVLGIAVIYPQLNLLFSPKNEVLHYLYQASMLSVAATLATLPVTLYYFHTFPIWFVPANLLLVPLSSLLIVIGLVLVAAGSLPIIGAALIWLVILICTFFTDAAAFFAGLPFVTIEHIFLSKWDAWILATCLFTGILYFEIRNNNLAYVLVGLLGFVFFRGVFLNFVRAPKQWIAADIKGELILVFRQSDQMIIHSGILERNKTTEVLKAMENYLHSENVKNIKWYMSPFSHDQFEFSADGNGMFKARNTSFCFLWHSPISNNPSEVKYVYNRKMNRGNIPENGGILLEHNYFILE